MFDINDNMAYRCTMSKAVKVLALLRKSTDQQDMNTQAVGIEENCERFGLEVAETFSFRGISGAVVQRTPEFRRMLTALAKPAIKGVVFSQLDRIMRPEDIDAYGALKIFRTGKKLMYCDHKKALDVTDSDDRTYIMATFEAARTEREKIRYRTYRGKERLLKDPTVSVTKLPRGVVHVKDEKLYGKKTKQGHYEYTQWAFDVMKPAFEMVASGSSINSVATRFGFISPFDVHHKTLQTPLRMLLENKIWIGIRERTHKRVMSYGENGERLFGRRIQHNAPVVHHTNLSATPSPAFDKFFAQKPEEPHDANHHKGPLVSHELFQQVQDIINANKARAWTWKKNTGLFLGTDFLYCQCGAKMYLKNDGRQKPTFVCSKTCGMKRLRAAETDKAIWASALIYFTDEQHLTRIIGQAQNSEEAHSRQQAIERAEARLAKLEKEKRGIQVALIGDPEDMDLRNRQAQNKADRAQAAIDLATAQAQAEPFGSNDVRAIVDAIRSRFSIACEWTIEQRHSALSEVVERIEINDRSIARFIIKGGLPVYSFFEPVNIENWNRKDYPYNGAYYEGCANLVANVRAMRDEEDAKEKHAELGLSSR